MWMVWFVAKTLNDTVFTACVPLVLSRFWSKCPDCIDRDESHTLFKPKVMTHSNTQTHAYHIHCTQNFACSWPHLLSSSMSPSRLHASFSKQPLISRTDHSNRLYLINKNTWCVVFHRVLGAQGHHCAHMCVCAPWAYPSLVLQFTGSVAQSQPEQITF